MYLIIILCMYYCINLSIVLMLNCVVQIVCICYKYKLLQKLDTKHII